MDRPALYHLLELHWLGCYMNGSLWFVRGWNGRRKRGEP